MLYRRKRAARALWMALVLAIGVGFTPPASIGGAAETSEFSATPSPTAGEAGKDEALHACVQCCSQRMVDCLKQSGIGLCFGNFYQQCAENCRSEGTTPSQWTCWKPGE
jgi:hypothetical protein